MPVVPNLLEPKAGYQVSTFEKKMKKMKKMKNFIKKNLKK